MRLQIVGEAGVGKTAVAWDVASELDVPMLSVGHVFRALAAGPLTITEIHAVADRLNVAPAIPAGRQEQRLWIDGREMRTDEHDLRAERAAATLAANDRLVSRLMARLDAQLPESCVLEGRPAYPLLRGDSRVVQLTASPQERAARLRSEPQRRYEGDAVTWLRERVHTDDLAARLRLLKAGRWHCIGTENRRRDETVAAVLAVVNRVTSGASLQLSCVVPARNEETSLPVLLDELARQSKEDGVDCQTLIVDDGSTDRTAEVAAAHGASILSMSARGRAAARNSGLNRVVGDVVLFLDADTCPLPGFLRRVRAVHEMFDRAVAMGPRRHVDSLRLRQTSGTGRSLDSREAILDRYGYHLAHFPHPWMLAFTCNLSMPLALAQSIGFDETFIGWGVEDVEFAYRVHRETPAALWIFDPARRVLHQRCRGDESARFRQWRDNLDRARRRHGAAAMEPLTRMEAVLDPSVRADLLEVCEDIYGGQVSGPELRVPRRQLAYAAALGDERTCRILPEEANGCPQ